MSRPTSPTWSSRFLQTLRRWRCRPFRRPAPPRRRRRRGPAQPIPPSSGGPGQPQSGLTLAPDTAPPHNLGFIDTPYFYQGGFTAGTAGSVNDFYFSTVANGTSSFGTSLTFDSNYGYLDLYLYNGQGQLISSSTTGVNSQSLSFAGLIPANYQLRVYAYGVKNLGVAYTLNIDPPAFVPADALEGPARNDFSTTPWDLGLVSSPTLGAVVSYNNLTLDSTRLDSTNPNDVDWYRFQTTAQGVKGDYVQVDSDPSTAPVFLVLYDFYMNFEGLRESTVVTAAGDYANGFDLNGAPAGVYYIAAFTGPSRGTADYSLNFVLPGPITKDAYSSQPGGNATIGTAAKLIPPNGTDDSQNGRQQYAPLSIDAAGTGDWYQFQIGTAATSSDFARIDFNAENGQLFIGLVAADQQHILGLSAKLGNTEEISLNLLPAGTYYLYVAGANGATNPDYVLTIAPPPRSPPTTMTSSRAATIP